MLTCPRSKTVGDYRIFLKHWDEPNGGFHGYLKRFLNSGDPTFQHIAIWTLLQLLESEDAPLLKRIAQSDEMAQMVAGIAERSIESEGDDDDDAEEEGEGEGEIIRLARSCLDLMSGKAHKEFADKNPKVLVDG